MLLPGWARRLNLSPKLLILTGLAATAVVATALTLPWMRMRSLVEAGQLETLRALAAVQRDLPTPEADAAPVGLGDGTVQRLSVPAVRGRAAEDRFMRRGLGELTVTERTPREVFEGTWDGWARRYRYATVRRDEAGAGLLVFERRSEEAAGRLAASTLLLLAAGTGALALALVVLYFINAKLVLRPVETLRGWAEQVREGERGERPEVTTGDEFERLAETFGDMLEELSERERTLRAVNAQMDVKLNELAESNEMLDEAARVKGEFLANVSHELRTPLNAIIGFAELLLDLARKEAKELSEGPGEAPMTVFRRKRYLENIATAARGLLEMIEGLLEMARLEAGRIEVRPEQVDVADACRGMAALIDPLAARLGVAVELDLKPEPALITTDPRKFQQVVFNLLSNAVKFSDPASNAGKPGKVIVRADGVAGTGRGGDRERRVRVSVIDNGPGIAPEDQARIFEKFQQLDGSATKQHAGTGLGLSICRELATVLRGEITLDSEPGRGSMFSLFVPLTLDADRTTEPRRESRMRSGQREAPDGS